MKKEIYNILLLICLFCFSQMTIAQTVDLTGLESSIQNLPMGTVVTWHTSQPTDSSNLVSNPMEAPAGFTYYAAFYDSVNECYSTNAAILPTIKNTCPDGLANLTSLESTIQNLPVGTTVSWHDALPVDDVNLVINPNEVEAGTYYAAFYDGANDCYSDNAYPVLVGTLACGVVVRTKVLLEGPYLSATGLMNANLNTSGLLPIEEPYTGLGFQHYLLGGGETVDPIVFDVTGSDEIVDWIMVELRDAVDFNLIIATRSALLQADGDVVDLDGESVVYFEGVDEENYYIVLYHRNHLSIMTPGSIPLANDLVYLHDFTTGSAYGILGGQDVQKSIAPGVFACYEADFNHDGSIDAADRSIAWNERNEAGYLAEDSNFSGVCDAAERSQGWNNRNKISRVP